MQTDIASYIEFALQIMCHDCSMIICGYKSMCAYIPLRLKPRYRVQCYTQTIWSRFGTMKMKNTMVWMFSWFVTRNNKIYVLIYSVFYFTTL